MKSILCVGYDVVKAVSVYAAYLKLDLVFSNDDLVCVTIQ
jgi:hypothetical protein